MDSAASFPQDARDLRNVDRAREHNKKWQYGVVTAGGEDTNEKWSKGAADSTVQTQTKLHPAGPHPPNPRSPRAARSTYRKSEALGLAVKEALEAFHNEKGRDEDEDEDEEAQDSDDQEGEEEEEPESPYSRMIDLAVQKAEEREADNEYNLVIFENGEIQDLPADPKARSKYLENLKLHEQKFVIVDDTEIDGFY